MPVFFARWADGDFSIVSARDKDDAYGQLDEFAGAPSGLWEMQSCLLNFWLTDRGTFRLSELGAETAAEILKRGYPKLRKALANEVAECVFVDDAGAVVSTHQKPVKASSPKAKEPKYMVLGGEPEYRFGIKTAKAVRKAARAEHARLWKKSTRKKKIKRS